MDAEPSTGSISLGTILALILGGSFAAASLAIEQFSSISANPIIGFVQEAVMCLILPGLIGSMAVSGNVHAFHLWVVAVINGLFYFGLVKFIYWLTTRSRRKVGAAGG
jgi:hypothetical protein